MIISVDTINQFCAYTCDVCGIIHGVALETIQVFDATVCLPPCNPCLNGQVSSTSIRRDITATEAGEDSDDPPNTWQQQNHLARDLFRALNLPLVDTPPPDQIAT